MKYLLIVLMGLFTGCLSSQDDEPIKKCVGIWEIELLHDGATAEVIDGKLHLRVENPQTDHDIRLIQRQTDYHPSKHLGIYVYYENFNSETIGANNFDMMLTAWYAYNYSPDKILAALSTGTFGVRAQVNGTTYYGNQPRDYLQFGGEDKIMSFAGISSTAGSITVNPSIQPDPKTLYIDFGVRQGSGYGKSSLIEVDVTEVSFGNGVGLDEFLNDTFDCNSLK